MFYRVKINDHIRVPPGLFSLEREEAIRRSVKKDYEGFISKEMGFVIDVLGVREIREGIVIPGDGAAYYECVFELLCFKPGLQEVVWGKIKDIADFGAFISLGPAEGMIHISQTMDDYVSFSKEKTLAGRDSGRHLKVGDDCKARIISISYKDIESPKLGLTMRQPGLGKLEWLKEKVEKKEVKKEEEKKKVVKKGEKKEEEKEKKEEKVKKEEKEIKEEKKEEKKGKKEKKVGEKEKKK